MSRLKRGAGRWGALVICASLAGCQATDYNLPQLLQSPAAAPNATAPVDGTAALARSPSRSTAFVGPVPEFWPPAPALDAIRWPDRQFRARERDAGSALFQAMFPEMAQLANRLDRNFKVIADAEMWTSDIAKTDYIRKTISGNPQAITALEAYRFGDFPLAKAKALATLRAARSRFGPRSPRYAQALVQAAIVHEETNRPDDADRALAYWREAVGLYRQFGQRQAEAAALILMCDFLIRYPLFDQVALAYERLTGLGELPTPLAIRVLTIGARLEAERGRAVDALRDYAVAFQYWENQRSAEQERAAYIQDWLVGPITGLDEGAVIPEFEAAKVLHHAADLMLALDRPDAARGLLEAAVDKSRNTAAHFQPGRARMFNALAGVLIRQGRLEPARKHLQTVSNMNRWNITLYTRTVAESAHVRGLLHTAEGDWPRAEQALRFSLHWWQHDIGLEPKAYAPLLGLADMYRRAGPAGHATWYARTAAAFAADMPVDAEGFGGGGSERRLLRDAFETYLSVLADEAMSGAAVPNIGGAFRAAQNAGGIAGGWLGADVARTLAARNTGLEPLLRARGDKLREAKRLQRALAARTVQTTGLAPDLLEAAESTELRTPQEQAIWRSRRWLTEAQPVGPDVGVRLATLRQEIRDLSDRIWQAAPALREALLQRTLSVAELRALLEPDEAFLQFVVARDATYALAIDAERAKFVQIGIRRAAVDDAVDRLRQSVEVTPAGQIPPFDNEAAARLHDTLVQPVQDVIANKTRLLVVADGPLQKIPLAMLKQGGPQGEWLAERHAFVTLPSAAALKQLRAAARPSRAGKPFLGIGNPDLADPGDDSSSMLLADFGLAGEVPTLADVPPLPDTETELRAVATSFGGGAADIVTGTAATEAGLRALKLADYRVISFATHGLMPGEIFETDEAALVLTPAGGADDAAADGLLTASEVAELRLDADLVILSACNTASGNDSLSNDRLSGLARSFFIAGARSVIVSHWPVASGPTVELMTLMAAAFRAAPEAGPAAALQSAMRQMREKDIAGHVGHPFIWAPFTVYGHR